jgi:hypothetical protein
VLTLPATRKAGCTDNQDFPLSATNKQFQRLLFELKPLILIANEKRMTLVVSMTN